ncbi:cyclin-U4-1-like [Carica papaya]|uniref:cyclin-U4-1-like n=1 Tax=Carica papaya TaxID=3649 RepID=UPI000B8C7F6D|nr:cyclin-U4-1-like [Carica papaya]
MAEPSATLPHHDFLPKVIQGLSSLLHRVAESNDINRRFHQAQKTSIFHALAKPNISIQNYLERIFTYANCSPSCFVVAYVYLDRFIKNQPNLPINSFSVHRMLIASVLVSAKFMDDVFYNNAFYARVGGISTVEMNVLEIDFLFGIGFKLNVTVETFNTYCHFLQTQVLGSTSLHSPVSITKQLKLLHCFPEDDSSTHHKQLAV